MKHYFAKRPRTLNKVCPICGSYFQTLYETPNKRRLKNTGETYFCSPLCLKASYAAKDDGPHFFFGIAEKKEEMDGFDPYRLLALSILALAVEDYKSLKQKGYVKYESAETRPLTTTESLEEFFGSGWAEDLAMGIYTSEQMLERLKRSVKA